MSKSKYTHGQQVALKATFWMEDTPSGEPRIWLTLPNNIDISTQGYKGVTRARVRPDDVIPWSPAKAKKKGAKKK